MRTLRLVLDKKETNLLAAAGKKSSPTDASPALVNYRNTLKRRTSLLSGISGNCQFTPAQNLAGWTAQRSFSRLNPLP
ncbi:MAG TPA: hypothetical protein DCG75_16590 [Bacteroidales bacterium]|jgi:hypothetical protein|nr:hypothetical protein [Bacteroidales bacterium]